MQNWNEAFRSWVAKIPGGQVVVAKKLRVSPSCVHYWLRDAYPRIERRRKIQRASDGKVSAHLSRNSESSRDSAQC